jgi:hypothetical protein
MPDSLRGSKSGWGKKLLEALTRDQIETLLDVFAETGALLRLPEELRAVDSDLADTVQRLVGKADITTNNTDEAVSKRKLLEIWYDLWGRWNSHVCEVGDEEGEYAIKDRDWDPPYFDSTALADDLEKIAKEMRPMLEPVSRLIDDPELFLKAADEIDDNILSFPEWMGVDDCCELGPHTTTCLLEWTWRAMERREMGTQEFLERIFKLDDDASNLRLNIEASLDFFAGLPENVRARVYSDLSRENFAPRRDDLYSVWHQIHRQYEQAFDPAAYLRSCEKHLANDWSYGEPLIASAISHGDLAQAESFVERTFMSLLRANEIWRPEDRLLAAPSYSVPASETGPVPKLLKTWETIAAQRGNRTRAAACRLQRVALTSAAVWPAMLDAFSEFESQEATRVTSEKLFGEWRNKVVDWCTPYHQYSEKPLDSSWVYWLIEARRNPLSRRPAFLDHLKTWLGRFAAHPAFFQKNWQCLALLTRNLPSAQQLKGRYPAFHAHVLNAEPALDAALENSLRETLTLVMVGLDEVEAMPIWREHLHLLVPSPDSGGSDYHRHASLMKALCEVNRTSYDRIIAEWKTAHRRRRNLWAEMASLKLPDLDR